mmetsp:Transcript_18323/g.48998  ORF Transcript_18323/g.48998 Transcript_18323/m.48998 type:complete len:347 (+) Transcript_18323:202-1242(+)
MRHENHGSRASNQCRRASRTRMCQRVSSLEEAASWASWKCCSRTSNQLYLKWTGLSASGRYRAKPTASRPQVEKRNSRCPSRCNTAGIDQRASHRKTPCSARPVAAVSPRHAKLKPLSPACPPGRCGSDSSQCSADCTASSSAAHREPQRYSARALRGPTPSSGSSGHRTSGSCSGWCRRWPNTATEAIQRAAPDEALRPSRAAHMPGASARPSSRRRRARSSASPDAPAKATVARMPAHSARRAGRGQPGTPWSSSSCESTRRQPVGTSRRRPLTCTTQLSSSILAHSVAREPSKACSCAVGVPPATSPTSRARSPGSHRLSRGTSFRFSGLMLFGTSSLGKLTW